MSELDSAASACPPANRPARLRVMAVAAATTLASLALVAGPAVRAASAQSPTTTTASPSSASVYYDSAVSLHATVRSGTRPLANQKVWFWWRPSSAYRWVPYVARITNTNGVATWTFRATRSGQWVAYEQASTAYAGSRTVIATLKVSSLGAAVVREASYFYGDPYEYGAAGPKAFDCSGYTLYVWTHFGKSLPHSAAEQYTMSGMQHLSHSSMLPGDFVFMYDSSGYIYHVAIYAGSGQIWAATHSGSIVLREAIWTSAYHVGRLA